MAGEVRYEVRGAAAWVIIDREEHRNALSPEVVTGLREAIDRVAADDAEFGTPEINIGLWPYMISAVIQRNVPRKVALDMMFTGRRVTAEEAGRWGMVNRVVPRAELDAAVEELVGELSAKSPLIL